MTPSLYNTRIKVIAAAAAALIIPFLPHGAGAEDLSSKMDRMIEASVRKRNFMGVALAASGGKVLFEKSYGMADIEAGAPNGTGTRFYIASLTKPFTAAAVLQLYEKGLLRLDAPVSAYLSGWPGSFKGVTIRQLLTHTAGIPDSPFPWNCTGTAILGHLSAVPPDFAPGERFAYSNVGYNVLGMVIESISGLAYAEYLQKNIFLPLGMLRTGVGRGRKVPENTAKGYKPGTGKTGGLKPAALAPLCSDNACGGIYSTVGDLYLFDRGLASGKLLKRETMTLMLTPEGNEEYAMGWRVGKRLGAAYAEHGGNATGYDSYMSRYPDRDICVIVLSNVEGGLAHTLASGLSNIMLIYGEAASANSGPALPH